MSGSFKKWIIVWTLGHHYQLFSLQYYCVSVLYVESLLKCDSGALLSPLCVVFTIVMSILEPYPRRWSESIQHSYLIGGLKGRHVGGNSIQRSFVNRGRRRGVS